ncbi:glutamine amidotransferase-related protein [Endozoicomonas numazuensis]|uniref:Glutamine amidotransferase domain-containing protein n=1 Tax=Endozoicomonas numazuensis TaxID=1137799 RepID=A0A081NLL8_9GAMM|nr:hypothetical protein [Endozoicomonas numazuensis]KEQ19341.1 hypothetical protein GZ78_05070 [Endozoicomonas numazuensis]
MKLGILECDDVNPSLVETYGSYPQMFMKAFLSIDPLMTFRVYRAHCNELPEDSGECDAYLITGSKVSAYEQLGWISSLELWIQALAKTGKKLLGICFGHQVIAQAMGGVVEKSEKGWGVGQYTNEIIKSDIWMVPEKKQLNLLVSHQDQVLQLPENVEVIAGSPFCPNFLLQYNEQFLTVQGHPEFSKEYSAALMEHRRGAIIPEDTVRAALVSLQQKVDSQLMIQWMRQFLVS